MHKVAPLVKVGAKNLLKRGMIGASDVARDLIAGKSLKNSLSSSFKTQGNDLLKDLSQAFAPDVLKTNTSKVRRKRVAKTKSRKSVPSKKMKTIFDQ